MRLIFSAGVVDSRGVSALPPRVSPPYAEAQDVRDSDAEYTLEYPVVCPGCCQSVDRVRVVRMLRTRVNFTSTLPRHGRIVICGECRTAISAALTMT